MIFTSVTGVLSCAHHPVNSDIFGGELHGHSYKVTAWFRNGNNADVRIFEATLKTLLKQWDHKTLPVELSTAEALARTIGTLSKCVAVKVSRPLEGYGALWLSEEYAALLSVMA